MRTPTLARRTASRQWTGAQTRGATKYSQHAAGIVVRALIDHHTGPDHGISPADFYDLYCAAEGIEERTMRAILANNDGVHYMLHQEGDGVMWACATADEGDATTAKLRRRATTELERASRRDAYANTKLGRQQQRMFGDASNVESRA